MLNAAQQSLRVGEPTIPSKFAADELGLAINTFMEAVRNGVLLAQATIESEKSPRPIYGFEVEYIREIKEVLPHPKKRKKGQKIFVGELKAKIDAINERWKPTPRRPR